MTEEHKEAVAVSHAEEVLCLTCTPDSRYLITGSKDSSLKMWDVLAGPTDKGGKLVQIMAGHGDHVTVVVAAHVANVPALANMANSKHLLVVSGSRDGQLIIWDAQHGCEIHSMRRHVSTVTCLKVTTDGSVVVSGECSTFQVHLQLDDCSFCLAFIRLGRWDGARLEHEIGH